MHARWRHHTMRRYAHWRTSWRKVRVRRLLEAELHALAAARQIAWRVELSMAHQRWTAMWHGLPVLRVTQQELVWRCLTVVAVLSLSLSGHGCL